jgi:hypothetical protein
MWNVKLTLLKLKFNWLIIAVVAAGAAAAVVVVLIYMEEYNISFILITRNTPYTLKK